MIQYIYESHLGGFYVTDEALDYESTYCDQCGDNDWLVTEYDQGDDVMEVLFNLIKTGYYRLQDIFEVMLEVGIEEQEIMKEITEALREAKKE